MIEVGWVVSKVIAGAAGKRGWMGVLRGVADVEQGRWQSSHVAGP